MVSLLFLLVTCQSSHLHENLATAAVTSKNRSACFAALRPAFKYYRILVSPPTSSYNRKKQEIS